MQHSFTDCVGALWHAVKDPPALTALLLPLRQLDHQPASPSATPAVNPWFPPLLYRRLTSEELRCVLPLGLHPPPPNALLVASMLQAILLPMRAKIINPDVTLQLIEALDYSLDAKSGIIAMISGLCLDKTRSLGFRFPLTLPCPQATQQTSPAASRCPHTRHPGSAAYSHGLLRRLLSSAAARAR
jgi:hypothetical protein